MNLMAGREFFSKAWDKTKAKVMFWKREKPTDKKKFNLLEESKDWIISFVIAGKSVV